ncbi:MAG: PAS domain S-box protein, partial [Desulfobulbaceae bacterium]|nr:PAS domain S-box protein [Desulfobulbaceae bacterium]
MNDNPTYEELEQKNRELKRQLVEYKQLAAHFRCIFRAIPDATVFADTDRRISTINPSFVRKFGYEEEELLGRDTSIVYSSKEDYEEQGRIRFNLTVKEKLKPYKMDYRKKSGEIFPA